MMQGQFRLEFFLSRALLTAVNLYVNAVIFESGLS